jgi:acyl carrier protein
MRHAERVNSERIGSGATGARAASVRAIVCETLGVDDADLRPEVSLVDDLAADSLDLLQLAIALEAALAVELDDAICERVRTVGDLMNVIDGAMTAARITALARSASSRGGYAVATIPEVPFSGLVTPAKSGMAAVLRTGWLTPYAAQTIVDEALRAGSGARVEITVHADVDAAGFAAIRGAFVALETRGVQLRMQRDRRPARDW